MEEVLWLIYCVLVLMLLCKDMSGKEELRKIREQLEKIAKKMEEQAWKD